jgi:hypothetical protein
MCHFLIPELIKSWRFVIVKISYRQRYEQSSTYKAWIILPLKLAFRDELGLVQILRWYQNLC